MAVSWLGGSGRWINGAFWSSGTIPTPADAAVIAAPGAYTVTVDASVAAASLTLDAPQAYVSVQGNNGIVTGLLVNGTVALQAGTLALGYGGALVGATVQAAGAALNATGGTLDRVSWQGTLALGFGTLYFASGLTFTGANGAGSGALQLYGYGANLRALDNETLDTVAISVVNGQLGSVGSLTLGAHASLADAGSLYVTATSFTNNGAIDASLGNLSIYGSFTNNGVLQSGTSGSLGFYSANFSNAGALTFGGYFNQISSNGLITTTNAQGQLVLQAVPVTFVNSGTLTLNAHSSVYVATLPYYAYGGATGGAYVTNSGLIRVDGDLELGLQNLLNTGTISIDAGGILDANFLQANGALPGALGTLTNSGVIRLAQGGTLEIGISNVLTLASFGSIDSQGGTIQLTRGALDATGGTFAVGATGTLTNLALSGGALMHGGTVLAAGNTLVSSNGTFDATTWIGPLAVSTVANGSFAVTVQDGFTLLRGAGAPLGVLDAESGAGSGSVTVNAATLSPAALNIDATLALGSDLTIDAASVLNAASGHTVITGTSVGSTAGTLTLQGTSYATAPGGSLGIGRAFANDGALVIGNGDVVSVGSLDGTGTVEIGVGELSIAAGASATEAIRFNGPGGIIGLTAPLLSSGAMLAHVQNFGTGDTIDLGPISADQVFFQGGNLILTERGTLVATVPFSTVFAGAFAAGDFQIVPNKTGGIGVTTTVPAAAATAGPIVTASDVVTISTATPFAALAIGDSNPTALDSVTVTTTSTPSGAFSNPGATGAIDGPTTYVAAGTAATLTAELQQLVFTGAALAPSVNRVAFTIAASNASGTTTTAQAATLVTQYFAAAALDASLIAFATTPDGSGVAAPVAGKINEEIVTAPGAGSAAILAPGYQALYLAGTTNATLVDPGYGRALLAANSGADIVYANGNGDSLVGGAGGDTLIATGAATIEALATGSATFIVGGAGTTSIRGPTGSSTATILGGSGDTAIVSGGARNLIALGSGNNVVTSAASDTIFAGSGAASITASASGSVILLGGGPALVGANAFAQTVFGGAGAATVSLYSGDVFFGGTGQTVAFTQAADTVLGGSGRLSVYGAGVFKGGSDGGNFLDLTSPSVNGVAFAGGTGDTLVSHGSAGGLVNQLVAGSGNDTLIADPASASTAIFAGSGTTQITAAGSRDTVFGGTGAATIGTGSGAYSFAFTNGSAGGSAAIGGFDPTQDRIVLTAYALGTGAAAIAAATVANGSETLSLPDGTRVTLLGFTGLTSGSVIG